MPALPHSLTENSPVEDKKCDDKVVICLPDENFAEPEGAWTSRKMNQNENMGEHGVLRRGVAQGKLPLSLGRVRVAFSSPKTSAVSSGSAPFVIVPTLTETL
jgi:hypothetical protein